ncbi:MAG: hypothetical protein AB7I38_18040 [Dehalococcoidia bacterium]
MSKKQELEDAYAEYAEELGPDEVEKDFGELIRGNPDGDLSEKFRASGTPVVSSRSDLGTKNGGATDSPSPRRTGKTLKVSAEFAETVDLGDDQDREPIPTHRAGRLAGQYRVRNDDEGDPYNDLIAEGHGFGVRSFSNPDTLVYYCRYCGDYLLPPDPTSVCEFQTPVYPVPMRAGRAEWTKYGVPHILLTPGGGELHRDRAAPIPRTPVGTPDRFECRCNGCVIAREGKLKQSRPRVTCGKPECEKRKRQDQNKATRERSYKRDRLRATEAIRDDPDRSDKEIAAALRIRPKRVMEAREKLSV